MSKQVKVHLHVRFCCPVSQPRAIWTRINLFKPWLTFASCPNSLMKYKKIIIFINWAKSAASFCRQVAAWLPDMFCDLYLLKKVNNSTTTKGREKNQHRVGILKNLEFFLM